MASSTYPRITREQRRRLEEVRIRREGARMFGIRGGASPASEPVSSPVSSPNYYELSSDDRALIEKVIADNQSSDPLKRKAALNWWSSALQQAAPRLPALMVLAAQGASFVLNLLGKKVLQPFELPSGSVVANNGYWAAALLSLTLSDRGGGQATASMEVAYTVLDWTCANFTSVTFGEETLYATEALASQLRTSAETALGNDTVGGQVFVEGHHAPECPFPGYEQTDHRTGEVSLWKTSGSVVAVVDSGNCVYARFFDSSGDLATSSEICVGAGFSGYPELGAPSPASPDAVPDMTFTPEELCDLADNLEGYPYPPTGPPSPPPPGSGPPSAPPVVPGPSPTPPATPPLPPGDPDFPGPNPPGTPGPTPTPSPSPGPVPEPPPLPDLPEIDEGILDPIDGGCVTFASDPPGFRDPTQPGGIGKNYQPGQSLTLDLGERSGRLYAPPNTDGCRTFDATDEAYCVDALKRAGWSVSGGGMVTLCPPASYTSEGGVSVGVDEISAEARACLLSGQTNPWSEVLDDDGVLEAPISRVSPSTNGDTGSTVCFDPPVPPPPVPGDPVKEKTCFTGPVIDAIRSVLADMGVRGDVIFDSDCDKEIPEESPLCFAEGTPKRRILKLLLGMCGFCIFPQLDGNVIVGHCTPLDIHWNYHEDVDLFAFDLEYDASEAFAYVAVYQEPRSSRSGSLLESSWGVNPILYPVATPIAVNPDKHYEVWVPHNMSQTEAMSLAMSEAERIASQAMPLVHFAVPLNTKLRARHQVHIKRPSLGFVGTYMITREPARDYSRDGYLSTGIARWLSGRRI